jgi:hypothetical protein
MENKSSIKHQGHSYLIGDGSAIVTFSQLPNNATNDVGKVQKVTDPGGSSVYQIAYWGEKNDLPFYREELIAGNNIVPALLERKRNILCGQGWYAYKERYEDDDTGMMRRIVDEVPMTPDQKTFFKVFKKEARRLVGELLKHGIAMPEFIRDRAGKVISVESKPMKYMRSGKMDGAGKVNAWYWSNYWDRNNKIEQKDRRIIETPVYSRERKQPKFVLPLMDDMLCDGYYPIPAYWGGRHWITLSNIIPLFHEANLRNGSAPRFHIVIPHDYFWDYAALNAAVEGSEDYQKVLKDAAAKEAQFVKDFSDVLTDVRNTGRPIVTKSELVESLGGKADKRIIIEEIKYSLNDTALLELYKASNIANVSAQALHPTLASIETAGKGIGSGTEIRNAWLLYLIIAAPTIRDMLLDVVELVKSENGWPEDIHFGIKDAEMTTLAENPAGMQQQDPNNAVQQ